MENFKFTYHVVNIKPYEDLVKYSMSLSFTYHVVNIKLYNMTKQNEIQRNLHIT